MNILPKKSWHVRNKDNVARVRKDEAQAAEEERVRKKRAELAEQEARTDFLRKKARLSLPDTSSRTAVVEVSQDSGHVNFFQAVEEGKGTNRGNKEYEEEKRKEKERQEKALGILTYLGQSASEAQTCRPWYQEAPSRSRKESEDTIKDEKLKGKLDPMNEVEKYLQKKTGEKRKYSERKELKKRKEKRNEERRKNGGDKYCAYKYHGPLYCIIPPDSKR
ncbi:leukocyte receptor cluster member 1 isoform X2 [Pseudophryne corroboree]|uniref:leukocyte receptor cluster member 1 isoform X2 n=1 Tax=Pseudophryne corroboree TaxID=495146 RepID=UPI0030820DC4